MRFVSTQQQGKTVNYLLRGDSEGYVLVWNIPELPKYKDINIEEDKIIPTSDKATLTTSLTEAWDSMHPSPVGILDQLEKDERHCKSSNRYI